MRIIAIDPGYERLGTAIVEKRDSGLREQILFSDCFRTKKGQPLHERAFLVGQEVGRLIEMYKPSYLAIENLYFEKNQKTAMAVAEVRGTIIYEARRRGLAVREYTPLQIKAAITGYGKASKADVSFMLGKLADLGEKKRLDDEMDAIAVGLTFFATERNLFPEGSFS